MLLPLPRQLVTVKAKALPAAQREDEKKMTFATVLICWSDPCLTSGLYASLAQIRLWQQENRRGNIVNIDYQSFCPFVGIGSSQPLSSK
jgi:hypothetical protein